MPEFLKPSPLNFLYKFFKIKNNLKKNEIFFSFLDFDIFYRKKKFFTYFSHQDDEFGIFIQLQKDAKLNNTYVFYLTSGTDKNINKNKLYRRDKKVLKL